MKFIILIINTILIINIISSYKLRTSSNQSTADTLKMNEKLESPNGKYFAIMQGDGNFVVYSKQGQNGSDRNNFLWNSGTHGQGKQPYRVAMQNDGNLVIYDSTNTSLWNTNTVNRGTPPYNLIMQDDGNLVLYDQNKNVSWATYTHGKQ